jgi:hypothetical protein
MAKEKLISLEVNEVDILNDELKEGKGKLLGFVDKKSLITGCESLKIADFPTHAPQVWLLERAKKLQFSEFLLGSSKSFESIAIFTKPSYRKWLIYLGKKNQLERYSYTSKKQINYGVGIITICRSTLTNQEAPLFIPLKDSLASGVSPTICNEIINIDYINLKQNTQNNLLTL